MPFIGKQPSRGLVGTADIDDNAVTLGKMAHQADGSIITYGTDTAPVFLATDTSGEVLTTKGAGALPAFDAVSSGFEALIGSTVISNDASISFTVDTTYDIYKFVIVDCVPATDSTELYMRFGDSGGIDSGASDYAWGSAGQRCSADTAGASAQVSGAEDNADSAMTLLTDTDGYSTDIGNATGEGCNAIVHVFANEVSGGTMFTSYMVHGTFVSVNPFVYSSYGSGCRVAALALTTVQFFFSSGNLSTGRITCFGLKHAA